MKSKKKIMQVAIIVIFIASVDFLLVFLWDIVEMPGICLGEGGPACTSQRSLGFGGKFVVLVGIELILLMVSRIIINFRKAGGDLSDDSLEKYEDDEDEEI